VKEGSYVKVQNRSTFLDSELITTSDKGVWYVWILADQPALQQTLKR
jgi:hypothetical protein